MRRNTRKKSTRKNKEIKKNKSILMAIIVVLIVLIFILLKTKDNTRVLTKNELLNGTATENNKEEEKQPITIDLTAIGDTLCHNTQYWDAQISGTNEYDFSYVYEEIKEYTEKADLTIGNLETTFAGEKTGYSNFPRFNSPDSLATALKDIGVDIITLAGNHALDYGYDGLCRTIDVFDTEGIEHLGTYKSPEEQEKIFIKDVKGLKIAFINYTYGTNGIPVPTGKDYCINLIDKDLIKKQINQAKKENVDIIIACMHWGVEYRTKATDEQEELADFLFQNGVDIILGNHPHVLEPMEKKTIKLADGTEKEVFVVYALGNFTADQRDEITRDSAILNLNLTMNPNGKLSINKATYVPIYMYKNTNTSYHKFKILDIEKNIEEYEAGTSSINSTLYNNLKVQLEKIKSILGDEIQ